MFASKDTPAQKRERLQWIVDVVRAHQLDTSRILRGVTSETDPGYMKLNRARMVLRNMHKQDRDALLQEGGILTSEQIKLLK